MKVFLQQGGRQRVVELTGEGAALRVSLDGESLAVDVLETDQGGYSLVVDGEVFTFDFERKGDKLRVHGRESVVEVEPLDERRARRQVATGALAEGGPQVILAPMPGKVVRVLVKVGQEVKAGEGLMVVEAMKMENELRAARPGKVKEISVVEGAPVDGGAKLCVVE